MNRNWFKTPNPILSFVLAIFRMILAFLIGFCLLSVLFQISFLSVR